MVTWRLSVELIFGLVSAALFLYTGHVQLKRQVAGEPRMALQLFATWWYALGALTLGGGIMNSLANLGYTDLALWQVWTYVAFGGLCVGLWGLLYYLVYLFTGSRAWLPVLSVFYVAVFLYLLYFVNLSQPVRVEVTGWGAQLAYANPQTGPLVAVLIMVIVLPQIIAGLAYFTLFFRVHERVQRYRIALVSWSIVVWFASGLVSSLADLEGNDVSHVVQRLISMMAAVLIVMAYRPPARIRQWLDEGPAENVGKPAKPPGPSGVKKTRPLSSPLAT